MMLINLILIQAPIEEYRFLNLPRKWI